MHDLIQREESRETVLILSSSALDKEQTREISEIHEQTEGCPESGCQAGVVGGSA